MQGRTMPSRSDWDTLDGLFNYEEFFEAVVALFTNDPQDPWTVGRGIKSTPILCFSCFHMVRNA